MVRAIAASPAAAAAAGAAAAYNCSETLRQHDGECAPGLFFSADGGEAKDGEVLGLSVP